LVPVARAGGVASVALSVNAGRLATAFVMSMAQPPEGLLNVCRQQGNIDSDGVRQLMDHLATEPFLALEHLTDCGLRKGGFPASLRLNHSLGSKEMLEHFGVGRRLDGVMLIFISANEIAQGAKIGFLPLIENAASEQSAAHQGRRSPVPSS